MTAISRRSKLNTSCRDAAVGAASWAGEAFFLQRAEGLAHGLVVEVHHWMAIVFLIAGVDQGVERKRIVVGRGDVFFDQGAENAGFDFGQNGGHGYVCLGMSRVDCSAGIGGQKCPPRYARICLPSLDMFSVKVAGIVSGSGSFWRCRQGKERRCCDCYSIGC